MSPPGLYRLKPFSQLIVEPIAAGLARRGVSPDLLSALALPVAAAGGLCIGLSGSVPALLLAVPVLAAARIVLNLLDGMVARSTGQAHPMGEMWNELGDRACDVFFIGGLAFAPGVEPRLVLGGLAAALLASYAGITARAAGGTRQYTGVMSKPGRMIVLGVAAPLAFLTGSATWLQVAAGAILLGGLVTLAQRVMAAGRELD